MSRLDYRSLLDRGRKSGLNTAELYRALTTLAPQASDVANSNADSNGFVPVLDRQGHASYAPRDKNARQQSQ